MRIEDAIRVPARQRLVEDARAVLVLGSNREVRIEQGRTLPPQHLQQPAAATLGRLVGRFGLSHRHAREGQELCGQWGHESDRRHACDFIWHLGDSTNLTTGVRLTQDHKRFSWYNPPRVAPGVDQQLAVFTPDTFAALVEEYVDGLELNGLVIVRGGRAFPLLLSDRLRPRGEGFGVGWIHSYSTLPCFCQPRMASKSPGPP